MRFKVRRDAVFSVANSDGVEKKGKEPEKKNAVGPR